MVPWRRKWQTTPVFLPRESHEQYDQASHGIALNSCPHLWVKIQRPSSQNTLGGLNKIIAWKCFEMLICMDIWGHSDLEYIQFSSVQFSHSVVSDSLRPHELQHARPPCPSPTPGQTHVHWVGDAIQPSHSLSSPSPPALNLSQHQGLCKWASSSHQVAKVLEFQLQHQSFQWTPSTDFL